MRGAHRALSVHVERTVSHCDDTAHLIGSSSEQSHCHLHVIHGAFSLTRPLPSSFTFPSCPSPSTSSTTSCSFSSTTRSSWQVCATPPQKRVRAPLTPPTPSQLHQSEIMHCNIFAPKGTRRGTAQVFSLALHKNQPCMAVPGEEGGRRRRSC